MASPLFFISFADTQLQDEEFESEFNIGKLALNQIKLIKKHIKVCINRFIIIRNSSL